MRRCIVSFIVISTYTDTILISQHLLSAKKMSSRKDSYVLLKYFARIAEITGKREEKIPIGDKTNLAEFLSGLFDLYGDALKEFVTSNGDLRANIGILVNGSAVDRKSIDKALLRHADVVVILPPIAGG